MDLVSHMYIYRVTSITLTALSDATLCCPFPVCCSFCQESKLAEHCLWSEFYHFYLAITSHSVLCTVRLASLTGSFGKYTAREGLSSILPYCILLLNPFPPQINCPGTPSSLSSPAF